MIQKCLSILFRTSFLLTVFNCAPKSIKKSADGIEILPNPEMGLELDTSSNVLVGKSFIDDGIKTSKGIKATVMQFHTGGKISFYQVHMPSREHSNEVHGIGFYRLAGNQVEIASYAYDSGIPGYRYFRGKYQLDRQHHTLSRDGSVVYRHTPSKYEVTRKWRIKD